MAGWVTKIGGINLARRRKKKIKPPEGSKAGHRLPSKRLNPASAAAKPLLNLLSFPASKSILTRPLNISNLSLALPPASPQFIDRYGRKLCTGSRWRLNESFDFRA